MLGVFDRMGITPDQHKCFVLMPFGQTFDAIYRLICCCCRDQQLECLRVDEDARPGKITEKIYEFLAGAGIVIADMTGKNPNVFYELGLAHAITNNVILLTQSIDDVPFDLKDFIHIKYEDTFAGAERLSAELSKALTAINLSPDATLDQTASTHLSEGGDDVGFLQLQADVARKRGDTAELRDCLNKATTAAETGKGTAAEIGNCAILAEISELFDLAGRLYESAIERDSSHVHNLQSFVSFVLDHRSGDEDSLERASQYLTYLEKIPKMQERTRSLRLQFQVTKDKTGAGLESAVNSLLEGDEFGDFAAAQAVLSALRTAKQYDKLRAVVTTLSTKVDDDQQPMLERFLADSFADSSVENLCDEAIEIYSRMVDKGANADVKHNLATLLFGRDKSGTDPRVEPLWRDAYREKPHGQAIRKAFAQFLLRRDKGSEAQKVLKGDTLD